MALLLNIDTATNYASVCISNNTEILAFADSTEQKDHAGFLHVAIQSLLKTAGLALKDVDAVSVTSGPGSYTGLRVGMATAKGICYALSKSMICINTLEVMTQAALTMEGVEATEYLCPLIDARRMEVFTAIYDRQLQPVLLPCAMVLDKSSFMPFLEKSSVLFFGSGAEKLKPLITQGNGKFAEVSHSAIHLAVLAFQSFELKRFEDIAYAEPTYYKEFHSTAKVDKI